MKKIVLFYAIAASIACSCTDMRETSGIISAQIVLTACQEGAPDTKTAVENGGTQVFWEPGDEIKVFSGSRSGRFTSNATGLADVTEFTGYLEGNEPATADIWAVYPYSDEASFDGETITTVIPSVQIARPGTFAQGANVAIAHSTTRSLQFYNVGGGIRFSLTEEGIRKVIFEGLEGEIVSGTVKVGFEEGLPQVKEVSLGSIFITLTPPDGGCFTVGEWYYLTAVPGALNSGFKLRLYKDDDTYGKVTMEKAYTIKRRIFGSVQNINQNMEYEAVTTHFPETEEEWQESIDITEQVGLDVCAVFEHIDTDNVDAVGIATELETIDNVISVHINSTNDVLMVQQKDGVWINVMLNLNKDAETSGGVSYANDSRLNDYKKVATSDKKALLLLPQYSSFYEELDYLKSSLDYAGIDYSGSIFKDSAASVYLFDGDYLDNYDLVYIHTHGYEGYTIKHEDSVFGSHVNGHLCLLTGSEYSKSTMEELANQGKLRWEEASVVFDVKSATSYFAMTPDYLNDASFNNTCIIIGACLSMKELNGYRYMANKFLTRGAGVYCGYEDSINTYISPYLNSRLIEFLCHGLSFQDSFDYWYNSEWSKTISDYLRSVLENKTPINPNLWSYALNVNLRESPYFLVDDASISLDTPQFSNSGCKLSWSCGLADFQHTQSASYYGREPFFEENINVSISYDVFVDNVLISSSKTNTAVFPNLTSGDHEWYVIANVYVGSNIIASYTSPIGYFSVADVSSTPEAVDLGLPSGLKWASCNVGATKPEEYGDYFAWGETEPKSDYSRSTYKWFNGSLSLTKYNFLSDFGSVDFNGELDASDDAASANLGSNWRTPTDAEWTELLKNCTCTWTTQNGVTGMLVTSNIAGYSDKSIFLPAAGYRDDTGLLNVGSSGFYLSSTLFPSTPESAMVVYFKLDGNITRLNYCRYYGQSVRPVSE